MIISDALFTGLIFGALALVAIAPLILLGLLIRDWRAGDLW